VSFTERSGHTTIPMTIDITRAQPQASAALAGVQYGWRQTLERLADLLADEETTRSS
ncbi:MAG: hypothetical protein JWM12_3698, partial [Ilumatobacteraceae bacterium]|nr:hypothetical protein [Ilumatobacteraceae bacterium]